MFLLLQTVKKRQRAQNGVTRAKPHSPNPDLMPDLIAVSASPGSGIWTLVSLESPG